MIHIHKDVQEKIEDIIDGLRCPKDFVCYKSGLTDICKAKDIGLDSFLVCLECNSLDCKFSIFFGKLYFCQCPLRVYISKRLNK